MKKKEAFNIEIYHIIYSKIFYTQYIQQGYFKCHADLNVYVYCNFYVFITVFSLIIFFGNK